MAGTYTPTATYRTSDPIDNLRIRVELRKVGTKGQRLLAALHQPYGQQRPSTKRNEDGGKMLAKRWRGARAGDEQAQGSANDSDEEAVAEATPLHMEEEEPDRIIEVGDFSWQQKVFGKLEVARIRRLNSRQDSGSRTGAASWLGNGGDNLIIAQQRVALAALDAESASRGGGPYTGRTLYTRTASEGMTGDYVMRSRLTSSPNEQLTPLARAILDGSSARRHHDLSGDLHSVDMHVLAELPANELGHSPNDARGKRSGHRSKRTGRETSKEESDDEADIQVVTLVTIRFFSNGRLDVRPDFSELSSLETESSSAQSALPTDASTATLTKWEWNSGVPTPEKSPKWHRIGDSRYEFRVYNLSERLDGEPLFEPSGALTGKRARDQGSGGVGAGGGPSNISLTLMEFVMPPPSAVRMHHFIEIESVSGFGAGRICVQFFAAASPGWKLLANSVCTGTTQIAISDDENRPHCSTNDVHHDLAVLDVVSLSSFGLAAAFVLSTSAACAAVIAAATNSAVGPAQPTAFPPSLSAFLAALAVVVVALAVGFAKWTLGIPTMTTRQRKPGAVISLPLEITLECDGPPPTARPPLTLFLSILRVDSLGRHTHLGYAQFSPSARAGEVVHTARSFRLALSRSEMLADMFVGGMKELNDLRALSIPSGFDGPCLNKFGLQTKSHGSITLRSRTILHKQPDLVGPASRGVAGLGSTKKLTALLSNPNGSRKSAPFRAIAGARSLAGSESAADRVRKRLQERREAERAASGRASAVSASSRASASLPGAGIEMGDGAAEAVPAPSSLAPGDITTQQNEPQTQTAT